VLGFGGVFLGVFNLLYSDILTSVGYMTTSILTCMLVCMINRIHVVLSIQSSIDTSKLEDDELSMTVNRSKKVEKYKRRYVNTKMHSRYCK